MTGFRYERGLGTKHGQSGAAEIQRASAKLCGEEINPVSMAIAENCCAELKSHSMHMLMPLVMLPLHHHHRYPAVLFLSVVPHLCYFLSLIIIVLSP